MQILIDIGQFLLVTAVAFAALAVLASFIRFQNMAHRAINPDDQGVDSHNTFELRIAHMLGTAHREPEPFSIVLVALQGFSSMVQPRAPAAGDELLSWLETTISGTIRKQDTALRYAGSQIGVILFAPRALVEHVMQRILTNIPAVFRSPSGAMVPVQVNAGIVTHPENGTRVKQLLEQATAALNMAMEKGPRQWVLANPAGITAPAAKESKSPSPAQKANDQQRLLDELTGVLRPERLYGAMQKYIARFRKEEQPVSVLAMDIDLFRRYNEHYGREAGDEILKGFGLFLQQHVREEDLLARYGGGEFVMVMGCPQKEAWGVAQRLAKGVKKAAFHAGKNVLRITVSSGVAGYPEQGGNVRRLLDCAHMALQAAKEQGRNMSLLYEPAMWRAPKGPSPSETF